jgi:hypothetical protein
MPNMDLAKHTALEVAAVLIAARYAKGTVNLNNMVNETITVAKQFEEYLRDTPAADTTKYI